MANISEAEIRKIVESIINGAASAPKASWTSTEYNGRKLIGIYADMNEAIEAADKMQGFRAQPFPRGADKARPRSVLGRMANHPAGFVKSEKILIALDNPSRQLFGLDERRIERLRAGRMKIGGN